MTCLSPSTWSQSRSCERELCSGGPSSPLDVCSCVIQKKDFPLTGIFFGGPWENVSQLKALTLLASSPPVDPAATLGWKP